MDRVFKKFDNFAEADRAEDQYYMEMSPNKRVELLLELVSQYGTIFGESSEGFERVFRVAPLEES